MKNNKKYKFNMKNMLFTLGASAAVIAPVTTLVACGGSSSDKDMSGLNQVSAEAKRDNIKNAFFDTAKSFQYSDLDVLDQIANNGNDGFLPVTLLKKVWLSQNAEDDMYNFFADDDDHMLNANGGSNPNRKANYDKYVEQAVVSTTPVKTISIKKLDIVDNAKNVLADAANEIKDLMAQNPNKKYAVDSKTITKDDAAQSGSYEINVYEKKDNTQELDSVINLIKSNKFGADMTTTRLLKGFQITQPIAFQKVTGKNGEWTDADKIKFNDNDARYTITGDAHPDTPTIIHTSDFNGYQDDLYDHSNKGIKDTIQFGTTDKFDFTPGSADMTTLEQTYIRGQLIRDRKTHVLNAVLTITKAKDGSMGSSPVAGAQHLAYPNSSPATDSSTETIYIPLPELTSFDNTKTVDFDNLSSLLQNKYNFEFLEKFVGQMKGFVGMLDSEKAARYEIKSLLMELFGKGKVMGQVLGQLTPDFLRDLDAFVKANPSKYGFFDLNTMNTILDVASHINSLTVDYIRNKGSNNEIGANVTSSLYYLAQFYNVVEEFINAEPKYQALSQQDINPEALLEKLKTDTLARNIASGQKNWADIKALSGLAPTDYMAKVQTKINGYEQKFNAIPSSIAVPLTNGIKPIFDPLDPKIVALKLDGNIDESRRTAKPIDGESTALKQFFVEIEKSTLASKFEPYNKSIEELKASMSYATNGIGCFYINIKSWNSNTGTLTLEILERVVYQDVNKEAQTALINKEVVLTGFMTQAEVDAAKLAADQKAAADWTKYLSDNADYLQAVTLAGLSHDQVKSIVAWNKVLDDAAKAGTLGKFTAEPKVTDFASIPAVQHQTEVKSEISLQKYIKDNAAYLVGVSTASMTEADIKALVTWNKHLEAEKDNLGTTLVYAISMPTQAEKDAINATISENKFLQIYKVQVDAAAVKLGFTTQADFDANKAAIIAEAKKTIEVDLTGLQAFIDNLHTQNKLLLTSSLVNGFGGSHPYNSPLQDGDNMDQVLSSSHEYATLKAEITRLVTEKHQTYSDGTTTGGQRHFIYHSSNADTISLTLTFDTKTQDGQVHHNSVDLTLYRH